MLKEAAFLLLIGKVVSSVVGISTFRPFYQAGKIKQIFSLLLDVGVMWEPPVLREGQGIDHLIKGRNEPSH